MVEIITKKQGAAQDMASSRTRCVSECLTHTKATINALLAVLERHHDARI